MKASLQILPLVDVFLVLAALGSISYQQDVSLAKSSLAAPLEAVNARLVVNEQDLFSNGNVVDLKIFAKSLHGGPVSVAVSPGVPFQRLVQVLDALRAESIDPVLEVEYIAS